MHKKSGMQTSIGLVLIVIVFLILRLPSAYSEGNELFVDIEQNKPAHGFFTDEDKVSMTITVFNNSTDALVVTVRGEQIFLGLGAGFRQDIEPYRFTLAGLTSYPKEIELDKRWEGLWELTVIAEATKADNTQVRSGGITFYVLHPVSDKFDKEIAEASTQAALSSKASADAAMAGAVVSVLALGGTIFTIWREHAKDKKRQEAEWKKEYQLHSQRLMEALHFSMDRLSLASVSYNEGQLKDNQQYKEPDYPLLAEAKEHIKKSYKEILDLYDEVKNESERIRKEIIETMTSTDQPSFENIIMQKIVRKCSTLKKVNEEKDASEGYVGYNVFFAIFEEIKVVDNQDYPGVPMDSRDSNGKDLLRYKEKHVLAHNEAGIIKEFDSAIRELLADGELRDLHKKYHTLKDEESKIIEKRRELLNKVVFLHKAIDNGESLRGYPACNKCPAKPS